MTPEPTPVSGMMPVEVSTLALGRDAHDGRADRGRDVDRRRVLVDGDRHVVGTDRGAGGGRQRRRRPVEARRSRAGRAPCRPTRGPRTAARRRGRCRGRRGRTDRRSPSPVTTGAVATAPGTTAGSYQRSGVVVVPGSPSWRVQSVRGSAWRRIAVDRRGGIAAGGGRGPGRRLGRDVVAARRVGVVGVQEIGHGRVRSLEGALVADR